MPKVRGSKQENLVVRAHRPMRGWLLLSGILVMVAGMIVISFLLGRHHERRAQILEPAGQQQLQIAHRKIVTMERDQMVDRLAVETSRSAIEELEQQVYQLNKSVNFYRSIMEPGSGKQGLQVQSLSVDWLEVNRYRIRWVLAQVGKQEGVIQGDVEIRLLGHSEGLERVLSLKELVKQELNSHFKFRYFRNFNVELELPQNFVVDEIEVNAETSGKKMQTVSKKFDWIVQETLTDVGE